jgi:hypothetical protein
MDAELKAKWVAALRSGEYQQTVGTLRLASDGQIYYCCLGVLYCVSGMKVPALTTPKSADLARWELPEDERVRLECMNDGGVDDDGKAYRRHTFPEIADYIEANL